MQRGPSLCWQPKHGLLEVRRPAGRASNDKPKLCKVLFATIEAQCTEVQAPICTERQSDLRGCAGQVRWGEGPPHSALAPRHRISRFPSRSSLRSCAGMVPSWCSLIAMSSLAARLGQCRVGLLPALWGACRSVRQLCGIAAWSSAKRAAASLIQMRRIVSLARAEDDVTSSAAEH